MKRRPKILEDEAFDPETPKAASKKQVRERNSSDTKKKRSKKVDKQPVETDQLRERENDSESTQDAPPPYTEYDENSSEPRYVIVWTCNLDDRGAYTFVFIWIAHLCMK